MYNILKLDRMHNEAMEALNNGKLETARNLLEQIFMKTVIPEQKLHAAYSLGSFHWSLYGNGEEAKEKFELTLEIGKSYSLRAPTKILDTIKNEMAYAAENLILLSSSYDEFEKWANELYTLAPGEPILSDLVPAINEQRERGDLWSEVMFSRGSAYINWGHFGSSPHPASGACIFHLMLSNRKKLRMSQNIWQKTLLGYIASVSEINYKAEKQINANKGNPWLELKGSGQFLLPFTQEYCDANPSDKEFEIHLSNAKKIAEKFATATSNSVMDDSQLMKNTIRRSDIDRYTSDGKQSLNRNSFDVSSFDKLAQTVIFIVAVGIVQEILGWLTAGQPFIQTALIVGVGCVFMPMVMYSRLTFYTKSIARYELWLIMLCVVIFTSPWLTKCFLANSVFLKGVVFLFFIFQMFWFIKLTIFLCSKALANYLVLMQSKRI